MLKLDKDKLLLAQARSGMTITELKEKSGVGRSTISKLMKNDTEINPAIIGKLAKALGIDVKELLDYD